MSFVVLGYHHAELEGGGHLINVTTTISVQSLEIITCLGENLLGLSKDSFLTAKSHFIFSSLFKERVDVLGPE